GSALPAATPAPEAAAIAPRGDAVDAGKAAKMATIQAAMERAKAQREATQPKNTEALTTDQQRAVDEIEARRTVLETTPLAEAAPLSEKAE
ncbi:MAG: electron transport complex subunit RsxC, partial [Azonexus sp.]